LDTAATALRTTPGHEPASGDGQVGCLVRLREAAADSTPSERRLIAEMLKNPQRVLRVSAKEIATASGVSEATVTRFAQRLGYEGYPEFRIALSQDLAVPTRMIHDEVGIGDDLGTIAQKVTAANIRAVEDTLQVLRTDALEAAVGAILNADRVVFVGIGGSGALAADTAHKFLRTGLNVVAVADAHEQLMHAALSGPGDAFVFISHTGATKELLEAAEIAKERGATLIAVTRYGRTKLSQLADIVLHTSSRETLYREEALASRIASLTITDILYVGVAIRRHEATVENVQAIRTAIARRRS
jgi:RpiR family carbohydrate utilization transcriptional regulator